MSTKKLRTVLAPRKLEKEELNPKPFVTRIVELRADENPVRVIIEIEGILHIKSP